MKMEQTECSVYLPAYEDGTDSVPKRRHIKFRRRGITQKKAYNRKLILSVSKNIGNMPVLLPLDSASSVANCIQPCGPHSYILP